MATGLQEAEIANPEVERRRIRRYTAFQAFRDAVQAIALDLYRAHLQDKRLEVGIGLGRCATQALSSDQYGARFLSARTFEDAVKAMRSSGLILMTTEHWDDPTRRESRVRRYQASPKLLTTLQSAGASWSTICRRQDAEGIILRGKKDSKTKKKPLISYGNIAFADEARDRLRVINQMLMDHWVDLALSEEDVRRKLEEIAYVREKRQPARPPDFMDRTLYRVFNNGDWEQGGRFNGAWWIGCPRELRPHILIDGKRTVEVDYSGLHAAMLFAMAGLGIPSDPYARCLTRLGGLGERKLVKQTFNALLNARSVAGLTEIENYDEKLTGRRWDDFKRFIVKSYPEFREHFGSGIGLRLQRKDSDLAEAVMLRFADMRYACLPVHDSFIVHFGMQDVLTETMRSVFMDTFGQEIQVGYETGLGEIIASDEHAIEQDLDYIPESDGYAGRLQAFRMMNE